MITLARMIRHRELLIYLWVGWDVVCVDGPHAGHAFLASRPEVTR